MRRVIKRNEPQSFIDWKNLASEDWQPSFANLANPQKRELLVALLSEQFHRCCYCGISLSLNDAHIEHFRPQVPYDSLAVDFDNLYASCLREFPAKTPLCCGHAKSSWFDEGEHINPQEPGCERRFRYSADGGIHPANDADAAARKMIEVLNLDVGVLKHRREDVLVGVFDEEFIETASNEELDRIISEWAIPDGAGVQSNLCHVVVRFAEQMRSAAGG